MSLTVAVAGKGGTGKSTLSALICRALRLRGVRPVLAVDADPNSCLPPKLGIAVERTIGDVREEARDESGGKPAGVAKSEWIERLIYESVVESAGLDLIVMGRQEGPGCYCFINNLLRQCLERMGRQYQAVVIDNEAGLEHVSRRSNGRVDILLVVAQPDITGARTAVRLADLARSLKIDVGQMFLVLNRSDGALDQALAAEFGKTGLETLAAIPADAEIAECERKNGSLLELAGSSRAATAVEQLVERILERRKP
jgi:CO dehydrogenase maturation factor